MLSPARDTSPGSDFLHVAYTRSNFYKDITFFKSFSFNLQGLDIDVSIDETFLNEVISFFMSFVTEKDEADMDEWYVPCLTHAILPSPNHELRLPR